MLTMNELKTRVPAAFSETHPMSDRYEQVPTYKVVESMGQAGYFPVDAQQDNPRQRDPRYVNHRIILRHEDHIGDNVVGTEVPQIILLNSHNGRSKMRLNAGIYRFVCANGLVVGKDRFQFEIAHYMNALVEAMKFAEEMTAKVTDLSAAIERWSAIELSKQKANEFAREAAKLRFGESAGAYKPEQLLEAHRTEDEGRSLWTVYNVVQENGTKGKLQGENANGRKVSSRPIKSLHTDMDFNLGLWNLAERFEAAA